jgi:hypothetical protein
MTSNELIQHQLQEGGLQVARVFEGMSESDFDGRAHASMMSPREILGHLCECYEATLKGLNGVEHEWGTYQMEAGSGQELLTATIAKRGEAEAAVMASGSDDAFKKATDYILLHDAYHVGQMAIQRLALNPDWNAYSLYGM